MQGVGHGSEARLGDAHRWPSQPEWDLVRPPISSFYVQTCNSLGISVRLSIFICAAERAHDSALEFRFVNLNLLPKAVGDGVWHVVAGGALWATNETLLYVRRTVPMRYL